MIPHNPMLNEFLVHDHQAQLVDEARNRHLLREARAARSAQRMVRRQERAEAKARRAGAKAAAARARAARITPIASSTTQARH